MPSEGYYTVIGMLGHAIKDVGKTITPAGAT
jgi:hypothetical protein